MKPHSSRALKAAHPLCAAVGEVFRELRRARGWSLEEVSVRAGVARQTVAYAECGSFKPRLDIVEALAMALGMRAEQVIARARRRMKSRR